ncbi:MAG: FadR/GntR family transcriptional regulator [Solirubrobacteraceae bacterium]
MFRVHSAASASEPGSPLPGSPLIGTLRGSARPARLATVVVEALAARIIAGVLPQGSVLPTEAVLCDEFGFSRTVLREGLKLLEERGLVRVEQGRGTTVQARELWNLLDPTVLRIALEHDPDMALLDNLITVRRLLESEMARGAALRLTEEELDALRHNIEAMKAAVRDYPEFRRLDQAFHTQVMTASGNEIGRTIVRAIHQHAGWTPSLNSPGAQKSLARTVAAHEAVLDALVARDGDLAAQRITEHIGAAWAERRAR